MNSMSEDIFDDVISLESHFVAEGETAGATDGKLSGLLDGHRVGLQRGTHIGSELGFYYGYANAVLELAKISPFDERHIQHVSRLLVSLDKFQMDPTDEDIVSKIEALRSRWRAVQAFAGRNTAEAKRNDAVADYSF